MSLRKVSSHRFCERERLRLTQAEAATGMERVPRHTEAVNNDAAVVRLELRANRPLAKGRLVDSVDESARVLKFCLGEAGVGSADPAVMQADGISVALVQ
jgi:hypothetical protein